MPPDDFVVRYCIHDNITGDASHSNSWYLFLYSNGTATLQCNYGFTSESTVSYMSPAIAAEAYITVTREGLMSMSGWHNDSGWPNLVMNHTERLCVEISGTQHIVSFGGNSLMGMMPRSFATLNNILTAVNGDRTDLLAAGLDLRVAGRPADDPVADISATFENREWGDLSDAGLCNMSWPTFVVSVNGTTVFDMQASMAPYCWMDFPPNSTEEFGPVAWNRTGIDAGEYVAMSCIVVWNWTYANISSDSAWAHKSGGSSPAGPDDSTWLILGGVAAVCAVAGIGIYLMRVRASLPRKP